MKRSVSENLNSSDARLKIQATRAARMDVIKRFRVPRPLKAIREKCLDCNAGQVSYVKDCTLTECSLWFYRMGRKPDAKKGDLQVAEISNRGKVTGYRELD